MKKTNSLINSSSPKPLHEQSTPERISKHSSFISSRDIEESPEKNKTEDSTTNQIRPTKKPVAKPTAVNNTLKMIDFPYPTLTEMATSTIERVKQTTDPT